MTLAPTGRARPPAGVLARIRFAFLVLAIGSVLATFPAIWSTADHAVIRILVIATGVGLAAHWVVGYRRGSFALAAEPIEAFAAFALLKVAPGDPFVPLFALVFRSLYGGLSLAVLRYFLWVGALLGAHATRGEEALQADLARALGLAIAPGVLNTLRAALERSEQSERQLSSLVQNSTDVVTVVGADLRIRWQADSIRAVLGHDPGALVDTPLLDLVHPDDRASLRVYFTEAGGQAGMTRRISARMRHSEGSWHHLEVVVANRLHDPSVLGFVLNLRDATERHRLEAQLRSLAAKSEHDAMHDPLTGLANRRKLFAHLDEAIERAKRDGRDFSLLLIDLDHFKELNDTLGHQAGDELLRELPPRLLAEVPEQLVARLGGDEFAVLLEGDGSAADAEAVADRLKAAIEQPFRYQGLTLLVRASIGIAAFPAHAEDAESLLRSADVAMYSAKRHRAGWEVYTASRDVHSKERLGLIGELPAAIAGGQLVVHYQPKVDLRTASVSSVEALVRWQHPERGLLGPAAFIPLAEQTGQMRALTQHVLERALEQHVRWRAEGHALPVAVNLSAQNLLDAVLPADVEAALARWDVQPAQLTLEITETIIGADPVRVGEILAELRALGVMLSLDDFGHGSSSLSYLRRLPVDELKIDKSFVLAMADDPQAAAIVRTIVQLAHDLGMRAVAEGIETPGSCRQLVDFGCDEGQGFLLGRPMPADEVLGAVAKARTRTRPGATSGGLIAAARPWISR
jgi:diguanylate cyclase (GGDEF)-like protein/PAS domain S-box-containing protein